MAWNLSGQLIETCSCNMFCPCWFGVQELMVMDAGYCATGLAFRIRDGNADGSDLGGRTVVIVGVFPGPTLFDGNGTARVYLDDGTPAEQRPVLEEIFTGKRGGPMEILGGLMSTWLPTESVPMEIADEGDRITISLGAVGQVASQLLRDGSGQSFTLRGGGFVAGLGMEEAELAPSASRLMDPDLQRYETKSGARGMFSWSG